MGTLQRRLHVTPGTVCKWRRWFLARRLEGLYDEPSPGREAHDHRRAGGAGRRAHAGNHAARRDPLEYARDGEGVGLSHTAISRVWHAFGPQPHRSETFKLSTDPSLIEKVRDTVGLHLDPPAHAAVFCVDEKPKSQALERTQPLLPLRPGQVERRSQTTPATGPRRCSPHSTRRPAR